MTFGFAPQIEPHPAGQGKRLAKRKKSPDELSGLESVL
jgi:hypothetical protein